MNKKLIAVAIAAALAPAAAMADSGNVTIYGSLHMSVDSTNGASGVTGSTSNQRETNISSNSSYFGFKGNEDLGNGLKAIWQLEQQVDMGTTGGTTNSLTSRNSFLGLSGNFGTAIVGIHDTPFKLVGRSADLFSDQIGDSRNLISSPDNLNNTLDLRPANVIAYLTPEMGGFSGALAHVTNVMPTITTGTFIPTIALSGAGATQEESVTAWSAMGKYATGPLMLGLGYEKLKLSNLNAATGLNMDDQSSWRLVGGYSFGDFKVTALYQTTKHIDGLTNNEIAGIDSLKRNVWGLGGAYKMGATTIKAQYYKANDLSGCGTWDCSQTGANMLALGADYSLSKRTIAYAAYARTNNEGDALFSVAGGGHGDNPGTIVGKDPSSISVGMKHSF